MNLNLSLPWSMCKVFFCVFFLFSRLVYAQNELHVGVHAEEESKLWEYVAPWAFPGLLVLNGGTHADTSPDIGGADQALKNFRWSLSPAMQSLSISEDGQAWIFRPKPGLHFPQGSPLFISDIAYSLHACIDKMLARELVHDIDAVEVHEQGKASQGFQFRVQFQSRKKFQQDKSGADSRHEQHARFLAACPIFSVSVELWRARVPDLDIYPVLFGSYLLEPVYGRNEILLRKSFIYSQVERVAPDTTSLRAYVEFREGLRDLRRGRIDVLIASPDVIQKEWQEEDYIDRRLCLQAAYGRSYDFLIRAGVTAPCVNFVGISATTQASVQE